MVVRILYFAALREEVGVAEEEIELPTEVTTVGALADHLAALHRPYADRRKHVRIARNEAFAGDDDPVRGGDVIALIPPVAGG